MASASLAPEPIAPPKAGGGPLRKFLFHPYTALAICGLVTACTLQVSWRPWMQLPVIGSMPLVSRVAYGLMVLITIVVSRNASRENTVYVATFFGEATLFILAGPKAWAVFLGTQLLVYFVLNRIKVRFLFILLTCVTLIGSGYLMSYFGGIKSIIGDLAPLKAGVVFQIGIQLSRILFFCWEVDAMPRAQRKFINLLGYCNNILFWPGPQSNAAQFIAHKKPRQELDLVGAIQLYRGVAKMSCVAIVGYVAMKYVPTFDGFMTWNIPSRFVLVYAVGWIYFLRLSGPFDIGTGLANLGGFRCEDTYHYPLFTHRPMDFWRAYNRPMVDYQLRMFGYPVARLSKNPVIRIVLLLLAINVFRTIWHAAEFSVGRGLKAFVPLLHFDNPFNFLFLFLLIDGVLFAPLFKRTSSKLLVAFTFILTQGLYTYGNFNDFSGAATYDYRAPKEKVECFLREIMKPQMSCSSLTPKPPVAAPAAEPTKGAKP